MENSIYEKDYAEEHEKNRQSEDVDILAQAISGGFLKRLDDSLRAIPKMIIPEYKANYEYLLKMCDDLAKQLGGNIRGVVDYERWEAAIDVVLPYAEFANQDGLLLLKSMAEKALSVTFRATDDGNTRIRLYVPYFENLISDEGKECLKYDALIKDADLVKMLDVPKLPSGLEAFVVFMNGLLDSVEQATQRDRTEIFLELLNRTKADDMNNIIERLEQVAQELIEEGN